MFQFVILKYNLHCDASLLQILFKLILMNYFKDLKELDVWKAKTCNFSFEMFPWPLISSMIPVNQMASSKRQPAMQSCAATCQISPSHPLTKVGLAFGCVCVCMWLRVELSYVLMKSDSSQFHLQLWRKPVIGLLPTMTQPGNETSGKQLGIKCVYPWPLSVGQKVMERTGRNEGGSSALADKWVNECFQILSLLSVHSVSWGLFHKANSS